MAEAPKYDGEHVIRPICTQWLSKIKAAKKQKWERFGQFAAEGMKFYDGAHDWMWQEEYATGPGGFLEKGGTTGFPTFRMTVNRVFEAVALFGPALYHNNPHITVTALEPPVIPPEMLGVDPSDEQMMQQIAPIFQQDDMQRQKRRVVAGITEHYLNWLQLEGNKKLHARRSIVEAIVKGMGVLWTELYQPKGSSIKYPLSSHISVDDIVVDPDADYWEDVQWIARYCCHPVNLVEREYQLPPGTIKGQMMSKEAQGDVYGAARDREKKRRMNQSWDLLEYWKVYSKNGFGDRLRRTDNDVKSKLNYEAFGDFCKIVVADNVPYPLNMPTWVIEQEEQEQLFMRSQWDIPFWTDGGWPFSRLSFYEKPKDVWPISLIKPVIGELRFINWCMSFLADKAAASSTTYVAVAKDAGMEIQNQLQSGMAPYTVIELSRISGRSVNDVVSFLDAPNFSDAIWTMVSEVMQEIDKRTGLTDLLHGMSDKQIRSATEADVKEQYTNIRPDDMAVRVEEFLSETSMKEMEAACWGLERKDYDQQLGPLASTLLEQTWEEQDFDSIVRDFHYRVEAGTARKPNNNTRQRALNELGQVLVPTLQQFAAQGVVDPWNAYITEVCKTHSIDPSKFLIRLPEPEEQDEGPSDEEKQMEMEMQMKQLEMEIKQAELQMKQQQAQQDMENKRGQAEFDLMMKQRQHSLDLAQDDESHDQEIVQDEEEHTLNLLQKRAEMALVTEEQRLKLAMEKEAAKLKLQTMQEQASVQLKAEKDKAAAQVTAIKAQARAKPSNGSSSNGGSKN